MRRTRQPKQQRAAVTDLHVLQLLTSWDFFSLAYGDRSRLTAEQWTEALARMARDWRDPTVRARVYAMSLARDRPGPPWAAVQFDAAHPE